jgi:hypothetical protein
LFGLIICISGGSGGCLRLQLRGLLRGDCSFARLAEARFLPALCVLLLVLLLVLVSSRIQQQVDPCSGPLWAERTICVALCSLAVCGAITVAVAVAASSVRAPPLHLALQAAQPIAVRRRGIQHAAAEVLQVDAFELVLHALELVLDRRRHGRCSGGCGRAQE